MKSTSKVLLAGITASALVVTGASTASATSAKSAPASAISSTVAQASFDDRDVVEFLAFGQGDINTAHPKLMSALGYEGMLAEEPPADLIDDILNGVIDANPAFSIEVTQRLQSGDPVAVEAALTVYNETMLEYVETSDIWEAEASEDGSGTAYCLVWPLAAAVAVVVAVVSTRTVAYVDPGGPRAAIGSDDRLTRQEAAAEIAATITN